MQEQEEEEEKEEEGKKEEQEQEEENLLFPMMHKLSPPPFRLTSYLCILRFWSGLKPGFLQTIKHLIFILWIST